MRAIAQGALLALILAACAARPPAPEQHALGPRLHLPRDAVAADGTRALLLDETAEGCPAAALYALGAPPRAVAHSPAVGRECLPWVAAASGDGTTLALHELDGGAIQLIHRAGDRLEHGARLRLDGRAGFPHPPPGRNLALSADGSTLLVGAVERECRRRGSLTLCGMAYLYRRDRDGWRLTARLERPEAAESAHFGQTVALLPDGALLVGGTGRIAGPGALHLFLPSDSGFRLAQTLLPADSQDQFYATELASSDDGSWLAVGGAQRVTLYRRTGAGFELAQQLGAPEENAGHFGEGIALDAMGRELVVGAPRATCRKGPRCGIAYRYRREGKAWRLIAPVRATDEAPHAAFGHKLALDRNGEVLAVQGRGVELIMLAR